MSTIFAGLVSLVREPNELLKTSEATLLVDDEENKGNMILRMTVPLANQAHIFRAQRFRGISVPIQGKFRSIDVKKEYLLVGRSHSNAYLALDQVRFWVLLLTISVLVYFFSLVP